MVSEFFFFLADCSASLALGSGNKLGKALITSIKSVCSTVIKFVLNKPRLLRHADDVVLRHNIPHINPAKAAINVIVIKTKKIMVAQCMNSSIML